MDTDGAGIQLSNNNTALLDDSDDEVELIIWGFQSGYRDRAVAARFAEHNGR